MELRIRTQKLEKFGRENRREYNTNRNNGVLTNFVKKLNQGGGYVRNTIERE